MRSGLFRQGLELTTQRQMIAFIRQDPVFTTDLSVPETVKPGCFGPRTVITPDAACSHKFHVVKNVCHSEWNPAEHPHGYYEVIHRTLVVGLDGNINILDGNNVVHENINDYLFPEGARMLFEKIIADGFYTPSRKTFANDSVLVAEHTVKNPADPYFDRNEKFYIQIDRQGRMTYLTHTRTGNHASSYGNFLPAFNNIKETEIRDFHERVITPTLRELGNTVKFTR